MNKMFVRDLKLYIGVKPCFGMTTMHTISDLNRKWNAWSSRTEFKANCTEELPKYSSQPVVFRFCKSLFI